MKSKRPILAIILVFLSACGNATARYQLSSIYEKAKPSVVVIAGQMITDTEEPPPKQVPEKKSGSPLTTPVISRPLLVQENKESTGPAYTRTVISVGFVLTEDGYILTVNHGVAGVLNLTAFFADDTSFPLEVIANNGIDAALVKIKTDKKISFTPLAVAGSNSIRTAQTFLGIGHPFGSFFSAFYGIVSRTFTTKRNIEAFGFPESMLDQIIHLDATFSPGVSGAPLLNMKGEVLAMAFGTVEGPNSPGFAFLAEPIVQYFQNKVFLPKP